MGIKLTHNQKYEASSEDRTHNSATIDFAN